MALDADTLLKTKRYEKEAQAGELMADLKEMRSLDRVYEGKVRRFLWIGIPSVLAGIGGAILCGAALENPALAGLVGIPLGLVGLVCIVLAILNKRGDLDDRRYELPGRLLGLLDRDVAPDQPYALVIDFRPTDHKEKFERKGEAGTWKVKYYRDPWLTLSGRFLDGTHFTLEGVELQQNRSKWKRSRSGKMKHKTKKKHGAEFQLALKFKPERYAAIESLAGDLSGAIQLPPDTICKGVDCANGKLKLRVGLKGVRWQSNTPDCDELSRESGLQVVSMMFLSAYQILNLGRELTKREAAG